METAVIGRSHEITLLDDIYASSEAEFFAVYGRRRVGKTYLINQYFNNNDAYFELGVIKYYPAVAITGFTSTLAWIGGMSGDRELGLNYLNNVADNGELFKAEANIALGVIFNNFENDLTTASEYYGRVIEINPANNFAIEVPVIHP